MVNKPVLTIVDPAPTQDPVDDVAPDVAVTGATEHQKVQLIWVLAADLVPSDDNLRSDLPDIAALADSIAQVGILEPLAVETMAGHAGPWRIIAGHRRHAAVQDLIDDGRWPATRRLPCTIGAVAAGEEARLVAQLVENLQRVDLDPIDEANGYRRLVEHGWPNTRIASATGRNKDRVAGRLKLLKLPDRWQNQLRAGEITLDFAAKLAAAPADVLTNLAKRRDAPSQYQLDTAIADHKIVQARTLVQDACTARNLTLYQGAQWQLARDHTRVATTTPTGLAKVLLPDDTAGMKVVIVPVYPGPSKFDVYVYAPPTTAPAPADGGELTALDRWRKECRQIETEHKAAIAAWERSRDEFLVGWVPSVTFDMVAEAAIHDILDVYNVDDQAAAVGWRKPPEDLDEDIAQAAWDEWFAVPRNRTATLALLFAGHDDGNPVQAAALVALAQAGLARPEPPELPPPPATHADPPPASDNDDDGDDLVAASDDDSEWDDDEPNPYATDDGDVDDDLEGGDGE